MALVAELVRVRMGAMGQRPKSHDIGYLWLVLGACKDDLISGISN